METVLRQVLILKGEEASQFLPQKGVNMDGSTRKKYKEKKALQSKILFMRQKLYMS